MREPHRSIEAGTVRLTPCIYHCESTGSSTTASTHITKPTATTTFCQEHAHRFSLRCSACVHCGDGLLVSLWAFLISRVALIASTDMPSPDTA